MIVSIITPSYNQGCFLAETIESVISQEGNFTIDYLIVDGGSRDDSVDIVKRYEALLQHGEWPVRCQGITYRWVSEPDTGQADALQKGFCLARGEIFAWLNSDDTYLPGALQSATAFFRDHPDTSLLYGDAHYTDETGARIGVYRTDAFDLEKLAWANFICQPAAFFRRAAFEAIGGLDAALHFAMDLDLWIRIGKRYPCLYLPGLLATYRLHEASKTIRSETLVKNCEEALLVATRHFGWAPFTRVYTACHSRCQALLPGLLTQRRLVLAGAALACSIFRSLRLNKGLHRNDLRLLNRNNFRKLFRSRLELMTGGTP